MASLTSHQPSPITFRQLSFPNPFPVKKEYRVVGQRNRSCELGTNCRGSRISISRLIANSTAAPLFVNNQQDQIQRHLPRSNPKASQTTTSEHFDSLRVPKPSLNRGFFLKKKDCEHQPPPPIFSTSANSSVPLELETKPNIPAADPKRKKISLELLHTRNTALFVPTKSSNQEKEPSRLYFCQSDSIGKSTQTCLDSTGSSHKSDARTSETLRAGLDTRAGIFRERKSSNPSPLEKPPVTLKLQELLMSPAWQNRILSFEEIGQLNSQNPTGHRTIAPCLKTARSKEREQKGEITFSPFGDPQLRQHLKKSCRSSRGVSFSTNVLVYTY